MVTVLLSDSCRGVSNLGKSSKVSVINTNIEAAFERRPQEVALDRYDGRVDLPYPLAQVDLRVGVESRLQQPIVNGLVSIQNWCREEG